MENSNMETTPKSNSGPNKTTKSILGLMVLAVLVWGVVVSQRNKKAGEKNLEGNRVFKIGAILPLTGDAAVVGEPIKNSLYIALEEINKKNDIKIELVVEDGKCNGKDATNAAQKLVNIDKVKFIVGGVCSGESLAAIPIAEKAKVLLVSPASTSPKLTGISPYFFRLPPSDNAQGDLDATIATKLGYKTVATIVEQTEYSFGIYGAFSKAFENLNGKTIKEEYKSETTDFKTQLTKLKSANPDALFLITQGPAPASRILKQMKDMNWQPKIFINEVLTADQKFIAENKEILEEAVGATFKVEEGNKKYKTLSENYKAKHGTELALGNFSASAYDILYLFEEGVKKVGYDGAKLSEWSRTIKDWQGAIGKITIKSDGDNESAYSPVIVKDGILVPFVQ